jgi:spore coat protein H
LMREKVASDLFRDFGIVSARSSFVEVYIDHGEGEQYYGLYTLVEEMDNTVIEDQMGDDSGNLYKPEGLAATFADGTFDTDQMYLKNNEEIADYLDVSNLYNILNSDLRINDPELWRSDLEDVMDIDLFLKWLAANTTMQNWDTYGKMTHNYYLYNSHISGKLIWIPWDNNEALQDGKMGGALSLSLSEVNQNWPLIRYLMDQETYQASYKSYLEKFINEVFTKEKVTASYTKWQSLINASVEKEEGTYTFLRSYSEFGLEVSYLISHVANRVSAVSEFIQ